MRNRWDLDQPLVDSWFPGPPKDPAPFPLPKIPARGSARTGIVNSPPHTGSTAQTARGSGDAMLRGMRRPTRTVRVGAIPIGGGHPIVIQSMTITDTTDTQRLVDEIAVLADAGCPLVRVTVPHNKAAEALPEIRARMRELGVNVPLVADIHFTPAAALLAVPHVEKVRINPGNYADSKRFAVREYTDEEYRAEIARIEDRFAPLVREAKARGIALRIGVNHGSLSDRIMNRYGDTPEGMVESALEFIRICEAENYREIVVSMKSSIPGVMVAANRLLCARMAAEGMDYPLHIGVTEAGAGIEGRIKSAVGIGSLLLDGIGDTIRVSLTEDSVFEIDACGDLIRAVESSRDPASEGAPFAIPPASQGRRVTRALALGPIACGANHPHRVEARVEPAPWDDLEASCAAGLRALRPRDPAARKAVAEILTITARPSPLAGGRAAALARFRERIAAEPAPAAVLCEWDLRAHGEIHTIEPLLAHVDGIGVRVPDAWIDGGGKLGALARIAARHGKPVRFRLDAAVDAAGAARRTPAEIASAVARVSAVCADEGLADHAFVVAGPALPAVARAAARAAGAAPLFLDIPPDPIEAAVAAGALLIDGIGDGLCVPPVQPLLVMLPAGPAEMDPAGLCYTILQACRLRLTRAEFIACPSCGRTQFDLQATTRRIQERTAHLSGVKIAVMGCIVNGPGEMADADFGYVGSAPGKIDLYVGKNRVRQAIPEEDAVERLVDLIRDHGRWFDPLAEGE